MKGLNRAFLIGHLGHEPEMRTTAGGVALLKINMATPNARKVGEEWIDTPDWHRLTVFGQEAEFLARHAHKGDLIGVECALRPSKWVDRDGQIHHVLDLVVDRILLLESRRPRPEPVVVEPVEALPKVDPADELPF